LRYFIATVSVTFFVVSAVFMSHILNGELMDNSNKDGNRFVNWNDIKKLGLNYPNDIEGLENAIPYLSGIVDGPEFIDELPDILTRLRTCFREDSDKLDFSLGSLGVFDASRTIAFHGESEEAIRTFILAYAGQVVATETGGKWVVKPTADGTGFEPLIISESGALYEIGLVLDGLDEEPDYSVSGAVAAVLALPFNE
jgi:hypothetical protein